MFYNLVQKAFNLDTILVPTKNISLMINSNPPPSRSSRMRKIYDHLNNDNYGYVNSVRHNTIHETVGSETKFFIKELITEDSPFSLDEIEMMTVIIQNTVTQWIKEYQYLFPGAFRIGNDNGMIPIDSIKERHENIEGFIIIIKQLKSMLRIYRHTDHARTILIKRSEFDEIVKVHTSSNNITLMVNNTNLNCLNEDAVKWLVNDSVYQKKVRHISSLFKNPNEDICQMMLNKEKVESLKRRQIVRNREAENNLLYLNKNNSYLTQVAKINKSKLTANQKIEAIEKERAICLDKRDNNEEEEFEG